MIDKGLSEDFFTLPNILLDGKGYPPKLAKSPFEQQYIMECTYIMHYIHIKNALSGLSDIERVGSALTVSILMQ